MLIWVFVLFKWTWTHTHTQTQCVTVPAPFISVKCLKTRWEDKHWTAVKTNFDTFSRLSTKTAEELELRGIRQGNYVNHKNCLDAASALTTSYCQRNLKPSGRRNETNVLIFRNLVKTRSCRRSWCGNWSSWQPPPLGLNGDSAAPGVQIKQFTQINIDIKYVPQPIRAAETRGSHH